MEMLILLEVTSMSSIMSLSLCMFAVAQALTSLIHRQGSTIKQTSTCLVHQATRATSIRLKK